jgi:PBP1b-binding outer membrane lipoprotein LpoB
MEVMRRGFVAVISLLFLLNTTAACSQQTAGITQKKPMPEKTIEAVLKEHTDTLMSLPGVVGTAQGECAGKPCIK